MDKILVTIYILTIDEEYDVLLPINLNANETLEMIQQTIVELTNGIYQINQSAVLYNDNGQLVNLKNTVRFSGLTNGCKLLLV